MLAHLVIPDMSDMAWIQIATLLTVVVSGLFAYVQRQQQRKWEVEDREDRRKDAEELARLTKSTAGKLALKVDEQHEKVFSELTANTQVSVKALSEASAAYNEANDLNRKIADLNAQLLALRNRPSRATDVKQAKQIDHIEATTEQNSKTLGTIEQAVTGPDHE